MCTAYSPRRVYQYFCVSVDACRCSHNMTIYSVQLFGDRIFQQLMNMLEIYCVQNKIWLTFYSSLFSVAKMIPVVVRIPIAAPA